MFILVFKFYCIFKYQFYHYFLIFQISMLILIMSKGVTELQLRQIIILASGIPVTVIFVIVGYLGVSFQFVIIIIRIKKINLVFPFTFFCLFYQLYFNCMNNYIISCKKYLCNLFDIDTSLYFTLFIFLVLLFNLFQHYQSIPTWYFLR